jgi:hypothetical protein
MFQFTRTEPENTVRTTAFCTKSPGDLADTEDEEDLFFDTKSLGRWS